MASTHFKRSPIEKKLLTYMPLCKTTYNNVTISPAVSHAPLAWARLGPICSSSLRSLAKKTKASKIISAASISRQYTLGEKAEIFLYRELKRRIFFTKINERIRAQQGSKVSNPALSMLATGFHHSLPG